MQKIPRKPIHDSLPVPLRVSTLELDSDPPSVQPISIALAFEDALKKFKELYIALASKDCKVVAQISLSRISDEYGRLGVWGRNSGADRKGRGSLDDKLRDDVELKSILLDILHDLCEDLNIATRVADGRNDPDPPRKRIQGSSSHSSNSDSDSDFASDRSSDTDSSSASSPSVPLKHGEMSRISSLLFEHIRSLYRTSALLRRPKAQDKYIRSVAKGSDKQKALHFAAWDHAHIAEKMWQWALDLDLKYESRIDATNFICARAAAANMRRREQLSYWQKHPDATDLPKQAPTAPLEVTPVVQLKPVLKSLTFDSPPSTRLLDSDQLPVDVAPEPSQKTTQSFSTVAQSVLNDNETFSGRPKTVYAPSATGPGRGARVPNPPDQSEAAMNFECPYCLTTLNSIAMQQRQLWKKHVFRDLRPYICTFEDCNNPEQMYVTRHDWLYHEMQMHRRRWVCSGDCELSFDTKDAIELHIRSTHPGTFTELQLPVIIDICERPADPNADSLCPLCPAEMALSKLQVHLATHLEEIALFVLPVYMSDKSQQSGSNEGGGNDDSSRLGDLPSLGSFSDSGEVPTATNNDPAAISKLVRDRNVTEDPAAEVQGWLDIRQSPAPNTSALQFQVEAVHDYEPEATNGLRFAKGQIITITKKRELYEYYEGEYVDAEGVKQEGSFPKHYAREYNPSTNPTLPNLQLKVRAVRDFRDGSPEATLHFPKGQIITVSEAVDADTYAGEYVDESGATQKGVFPRNHVEIYEAPEQEAGLPDSPRNQPGKLSDQRIPGSSPNPGGAEGPTPLSHGQASHPGPPMLTPAELRIETQMLETAQKRYRAQDLTYQSSKEIGQLGSGDALGFSIHDDDDDDNDDGEAPGSPRGKIPASQQRRNAISGPNMLKRPPPRDDKPAPSSGWRSRVVNAAIAVGSAGAQVSDLFRRGT